MFSSDGFLDYVIDILSPHYPIKARKMFGGYGLYVSGKVFGIIVNDELYFKANNSTKSFFTALNSKPFGYERKDGKMVYMSYFTVPPEVLENQDLLKKWIEVALQS